jgi:hypothetical protein
MRPSGTTLRSRLAGALLFLGGLLAILGLALWRAGAS